MGRAKLRTQTTPDERREAGERIGEPTCPECLTRMPIVRYGYPLREGGWASRRCPGCGSLWRVDVRETNTGLRVVGYERRGEVDSDPAEEITIMPKKNETKQAAGQKQAGEKSQEKSEQPTPTPHGREATITAGVKAMRTPKATATPTDTPVELIIDQAGIHSLTAGARPAEKAPAKAKAAETKAPAESAGVPDQAPDDLDLVVFAFRLTREERDLIHAAAGAAKASKFARNLLVACARGDNGTVLGILDTIQAPEGGGKK